MQPPGGAAGRWTHVFEVHAQHSVGRSAGSRVGTTGRLPCWLTLGNVLKNV
jgi:hypothetical protein